MSLLSTVALGFIVSSNSAYSATLVNGEFRTIGDTNSAGQSVNPAVSVTSGSEGYSTGNDGYGTGGLDGSFNGSILDYAFYSNSSGITENLGGAGSYINTPTGSPNADVANAFDVWAGAPTSGAANSDLYMRADNIVGTVSLSGLTSGSLYMFFGTRVGIADLYSVTFTLSGSGQTDVTLTQTGIYNLSQGGTQNNTWFVYRADFADAAGYDTLTYEYDYTSSATNSARGRFGGLVLTSVPEPSSAMLLGLAGAAMLLRRRRR